MFSLCNSVTERKPVGSDDGKTFASENIPVYMHAFLLSMNASLVNIFIHNIVNFYVPQDYSYMNGENHLAQVSGVFKYVYVYLLGK